LLPSATGMLRRLLSLALVVALLAPASALGQQNQSQDPFPPLPQPQPTAAPAPEDDDGFLGLNNEIGGSATLYIIAGALLVAFIAIGMFISRDARRTREQGPHRHKRQAKARARARTKAQRSARRKNR
jgi:hypothetical protein